MNWHYPDGADVRILDRETLVDKRKWWCEDCGHEWELTVEYEPGKHGPEQITADPTHCPECKSGMIYD